MNAMTARHHTLGGFVMLALVGTLIFVWGVSSALAQESLDMKGGIGFVIATNGTVTISSKTGGPRPASLRQNVFPNDLIKTGPNSSAKILFEDNTILNVTENTQIEIYEFVYDPASKQRRTIFNMLQGRVKALVAASYAATNSRFEIRTATATAAARGTEYVVWTCDEQGQVATPESTKEGQTVSTCVAVTTGTVIVTDLAGQNVTVSAGQFTVISPFAPPRPPAPITPPVQQQIKEGDVKTNPALAGQVAVTIAQQDAANQPPPPPPTTTVTTNVLSIIKCTFATPGATPEPPGCTP